MAALLRDRITIVWLMLFLATAMSWWVGTSHGVDDIRLATVAVMVVAFTKVRFVGCYFMELRHAPVSLRLVFETWCVTVCAVVVALYLSL